MLGSKEKSAELFKQYIEKKNILIVDPCVVSRANIASVLIKLGATTSRVKLCAHYDDAQEVIKKIKPEIVLCEYLLKGRSGLDLLNDQREQQPELRDSLFILVTSNTSQSAVAEAAEEDVDAYILKPFTIDVFRNILQSTAIQKAHPSDYIKKIETGKQLLKSNQKDSALACFKEAVKMDDKPTLAHFYTGHTHVAKDEIDPAQSSFTDGLKINKIHYKCLVGLYETYMSQKQYFEAYDIVKKIARYFPANPKRLAAVLRLAITTKNYDDIERYYQNFINLDVRTETLIRYICASLIVCGKYYLQKKYSNRAVELFNKAMATAAGNPKILREIIISLASENLIKEATDVLNRFSHETRGDIDFQAMECLIASHTMSPGLVIDHCRKLISMGAHDPVIYEILISKSVEHNLGQGAQDYVKNAIERWPDQKEFFQGLLNDTLNKQAA